MANSKYEYVKTFERDDSLLPNCYIVVRIDGHSFHRFTRSHDFAKPNDARALHLMNRAATCVMSQFPDIFLAYGSSDEYSFVIHRNYTMYDRRESKLVTSIVSLFTGAYIMHWPEYINTGLKYAPSFDGRAVLYPTYQSIRDYLAWRQVDAHINNLHNTTFWALQLLDNKNGTAKLSAEEADTRLKGSMSGDKNEILFKEYGINYNNEEDMFKKGSILVYEPTEQTNEPSQTNAPSAGRKGKRKKKQSVITLHVDLIQDVFWQRFSTLLD